MRAGANVTRKDAFDVIGELTFSKPLGFLEKGNDVDGIIVALEHMLDYSGKVGIATDEVINKAN
jgi:hypothetical protein